MFLRYLSLFFSLIPLVYGDDLLPVVINTWAGSFVGATETAWGTLQNGLHRTDAIEQGCSYCEAAQCDGSVGYGNHPDSNGEVTLDAMIMDGPPMHVGAVGGLKRIKSAISVARAVMEHTGHTMLVGDGATEFAKMMGFEEESLSTEESDEVYASWVEDNCQPNYYRNVVNKTTQCPPYKPFNVTPPTVDLNRKELGVGYDNHDTIGMVVVDINGDLACGVTTNGANHKVAGRVGDGPIVGAGCYVDNNVGGAAETGDGDIMMRFLPSFRAVMNMKSGMSPTEACEEPIKLIAQYYPDYSGGIVCVNKTGHFGAAGYGWTLSYAVRNPSMNYTSSYSVPPVEL